MQTGWMSEAGIVKPYAAGIDVGGTKIVAGVLDRSMNMLSVHMTKDHAGQLPARVVDSIERTYWEALKQARVSPDDVAGVGLSFAGHTDGRRGIVLASSNMPEWDRLQALAPGHVTDISAIDPPSTSLAHGAAGTLVKHVGCLDGSSSAPHNEVQ
jgi:hypothetical protein